jgi:hypothetical protein
VFVFVEQIFSVVRFDLEHDHTFTPQKGHIQITLILKILAHITVSKNVCYRKGIAAVVQYTLSKKGQQLRFVSLIQRVSILYMTDTKSVASFLDESLHIIYVFIDFSATTPFFSAPDSVMRWWLR